MVILVCVRFFQTSFWVVREILHAQTLKIRAEVLSLYIRTAKVHKSTHDTTLFYPHRCLQGKFNLMRV